MKSLFLYEDIEKKAIAGISPGVYKFENFNLVGIDTNKLNKRERNYYEKEWKLREFHVLQKWFSELIYNANDIGIFITKIELDNIDNLEDIDLVFDNINNLINHQNNKELLSYLVKLHQEYGTDIEAVSFVFLGMQCRITSSGILEIYSYKGDDKKYLDNYLLWAFITGQGKKCSGVCNG